MLEDLSPDVAALVAEHNAEALEHFLGYIHDYVVANIAALPPGNLLPVSKLHYPADHVQIPYADGSVGVDAEAGGALQEFRMEVLISSPFVALSGDTAPNHGPCRQQGMVQQRQPGVVMFAM